MSLHLKNVKVFGHPQAHDLLIDLGKIQKIGTFEAQTTDQVINCDGAWLLPALCDRLVFENEDRLDLDRAACAGGISEMLVMPNINTQPAFHPQPLKQTKTKSIYAAPITYQTDEDEKLAEIALAYQAGSRFFSNGASAIADSALMRQAMFYVADMGATLIHQPQEAYLARYGVMHEGVVSARLGLKAIPRQAETIQLTRDIELVKQTRCNYIAAQISTADAVPIIHRAKQEGLPVRCGVSINHLLLNENSIGDFRTFCKLLPPLRTETDRQALLQAVKDGTIDYIVSAHNPQTQETKRLPFELAAFGSVGLETLLPALFVLHQQDHIPLETLIKAVTQHPIEIGANADLVCYHPDKPWQLDVATKPLKSKTQNAALDGQQFYGKIMLTINRGEVLSNALSD